MADTAANQENGRRYVVVTAAYNEEKYLERLIQSVIAQTLQPLRWVIVSDGSTDRTDEIVKSYGAEHDFIRLHRITEDHPRNFTAQVHAINAGFSQLGALEFDFVGNLDADVTLDAEYFGALLRKFHEEPALGMAGGDIWEHHNGYFSPRRMNNPRSVAHAVQLFRRDCWEQLGKAYLPLPYGGPDWHAEVTARMKGWAVHSFTDLPVYHHRPTGGVDGWLKSAQRLGNLDHSLGTHPLFELFRVARRLGSKPYVVAAMIRFFAFIDASCRQQRPDVSKEFVAFLRKEELARLKMLLGIGRRPAANINLPGNCE